MKRLVIAAVLGCAIAAPSAAAQAPGYAIPPDNPFVGVPGARGEIYVRGLRNPFRWSFDRLTGDMLIGDVGGEAREEIDWLPRAQTAGANLGWNCFEGSIAGPGNCTLASHVVPVYDYGRPASGGAAVTGGHVVRAPNLPSFAGRYLFGDFFANRFANEIQVLTLGPGAAPINAGETVEVLVAFGEDAAGRLYAVSLNGPVYRLSESQAQLEKTSIGSFVQPMAVAEVPGSPDSLFVVERAGVLRLRIGTTVHEFLDISDSVDTAGERGLLAAAAAPDYAVSGRVYVFYADDGGDLRIDEVRRSTADPTRADPATRRSVLTVEHSSASTHNGGQLLFGPDGYLYLSIGDGGAQGDPEGDAQSLGTLLGKVIRIDVDGEPVVPPDTPDPPSPPTPPAPQPPSAAGPSNALGPLVVAPDRTAPKFRVRVARRQRALRLGGVVANVRCEEACRLSAGGWVTIGRRIFTLRKAKRRLAAAGKRVRIEPRLTERATQALREALLDGRRPRVRLGLRARDAAGNASPLLRVTVRVGR